MAKQHGLIKAIGKVGDHIYMQSKDGFLIRTKTTLSGDRIKTDPSFERVRENMSEFGRACSAGKVLRSALRPVLQHASDHRVISRLVKAMMQVLHTDTVNPRGKRSFIEGNTELLQGFDFNKESILDVAFFAPFDATIDRTAGTAEVKLPAFIPANSIVAPPGATHFKIVTMGAEISFNEDSSVTDAKDTGLLPINGMATPAITLANQLPAASTLPLFLAMGIQFFQVVNGYTYPLKSGAFNALRLVRVSHS